ncbi:hypothetical protein [Candidatus Uabimicrobium amorphum]|uniref:Uncharacterized protein n=1 Tax=Uabimicrobium amorphum TaxID=2596890 RepID=A0A5S9INC9_UABAM|nr:hypothetical protein [Candidatus Uabimicrobium amorphum]BBM84502.1 hypothetical protein UABAM_02863 [Candidatus Uabimicrobium amorphum]
MNLGNEFQEILNTCKCAKFYEFGIDEVIFNHDEQDPLVVIKMGHYKCGDFEIIFKEVLHHSIMSESYIYMHDEDHWQEKSFIAQAKTSQYAKFIGSYTLLYSQLEVHDIDESQLKHFRVLSQNFFVDILTTEIPQFKMIITDQ